MVQPFGPGSQELVRQITKIQEEKGKNCQLGFLVNGNVYPLKEVMYEDGMIYLTIDGVYVHE